MTAPTYLDYCYGEEMEIDSFCRLPRIFVTNEFYCTVPAEVKILYGLMLDRVAMSMRNNWREDGRVFIYFTVESAAHLLNVSRYKAIRLFDLSNLLGECAVSVGRNCENCSPLVEEQFDALDMDIQVIIRCPCHL